MMNSRKYSKFPERCTDCNQQVNIVETPMGAEFETCPKCGEESYHVEFSEEIGDETEWCYCPKCLLIFDIDLEHKHKII